MANKYKRNFSIFHTRINRSTTIVAVRKDLFNPNTFIVEFQHELPANYFKESVDTIFGLYLDRVFMREFKEKQVKVQLENTDVNQILEIFAHPHSGYEFIRSRLEPGNKIRIRFRAKNPNVKDVTKHKIFWDGGTGTYQTKIMGEVDAKTGEASGRYLKSGEIIN